MSRDLHSGAAGGAASSPARPVWLQLFDEFMATMGSTDPTPCDAIAANSYLHMAFIGQVRSDAASIAEAVEFIRATDPSKSLEFIVPEGVNADVLESFTRAGVTLMTAAEHQAAHPEQHPAVAAEPHDSMYAIHNDNLALVEGLISHSDPAGQVELGGEAPESKGDDQDDLYA